nr:F-box domain, leucine-rich repeat domain, L domain-like protein [Tanacetum cinerariifolium]
MQAAVHEMGPPGDGSTISDGGVAVFDHSNILAILSSSSLAIFSASSVVPGRDADAVVVTITNIKIASFSKGMMETSATREYPSLIYTFFMTHTVGGVFVDPEDKALYAYNTNKAAFKAQHWVMDPTTGTYNVEKIRRERPENIMASEWDKYIEFWNDPRNIARAAQNRQNRAKSTTSTTQEYPSLIDTFFVAHTVNGEFLRDEDRRIYEEMRRLEAMGTYTDDEINRLARGGKQRGHIAGVGRVLPARATASPSTPAHDSTLNSLHKKVDFMMSIFKSDSKYSDMFSQFESGGASGSGGCGDEEEGADHQEDEDKDGDGDA